MRLDAERLALLDGDVATLRISQLSHFSTHC
jgi:hypothetical protein